MCPHQTAATSILWSFHSIGWCNFSSSTLRFSRNQVVQRTTNVSLCTATERWVIWHFKILNNTSHKV